MVTLYEESVMDGHDCWGKVEWKTVYILIDEDDNVIYKSTNEPAALITFLLDHGIEVINYE